MFEHEILIEKKIDTNCDIIFFSSIRKFNNCNITKNIVVHKTIKSNSSNHKTEVSDEEVDDKF